MSRTIIRQISQIRNSDTYNDTLDMSGAETSATNIQDDLNYTRSQLKNITGQTNWSDDITDDFNLKEIHDKTLVSYTSELNSISVSLGNNYVLLTGSSKPDYSIAINATTLGAIVAQLVGSIGSHSTEVATDRGNLATIVELSTGSTIYTTSGYEVFGLLQVGSSATDGHAFGDSGNDQGQLSFVYINPATDTITACPIATIESKTIIYYYKTRFSFYDIPETAFIFSHSTTESLPITAITTTPASSTRNIIQPTNAAYIPLTIKGATSQTADLLQIKDSTDVALYKFDSNNNIILGTGSAGTSANKTFMINTGIAPSTSPADAFQLYSSDYAAGNAVPTFRTENGTIIKLNQDLSAVGNPTFASLISDSAVTIKQITTPSNPSAGYNKLYFKSDGVLYKLNSTGVENAIPSDLTMTDGGKNNLATNSYINGPDGIPMNISPFILPFDAYLVSMSASTDGNETWTAEVHVNSVLKAGATLPIVAADNAYHYTYSSITFGAGDKIMIYCNGSSINKPRVNVVFGRL